MSTTVGAHGARLFKNGLWPATSEVDCAINTVRRHLALNTVPKYERKVMGHVIAPAS